MKGNILIDRAEINVRFSEVDSMGVVWHGNYAKYFEDGRESFGSKYGIGYIDVLKNKLATPIVSMNINYKRPLLYTENAIIETTYIPTEAAFIKFKYRILRASDDEVLTSGETTQAFVNLKGVLVLYTPPFYEEWKKKWNQDIKNTKQ